MIRCSVQFEGRRLARDLAASAVRTRALSLAPLLTSRGHSLVARGCIPISLCILKVGVFQLQNS